MEILGSMLIEFIGDGIRDSKLSIVECLPDIELDEDTYRRVFHSYPAAHIRPLAWQRLHETQECCDEREHHSRT